MPVRTGYFSEVTRDNAYKLSMDTHEPQQRRIYALLVAYRKLTRWQISERTGIPLHTVCARIKALMDLGVVKDTMETHVNNKTKKKNTYLIPVTDLTLFNN